LIKDVPDTNILIVNIELKKTEVTVVINLKWSNLDYPFCHLVGRPHLTFPVTTLSGARFHDLENWPVISRSVFRQVLLVRSYQGG